MKLASRLERIDPFWVMEMAKAAREAMGGNTLRRSAAKLVMAGMTTVDEAMGVSAEADE